MDWVGWYPGGRGYRAPYGANKLGVDHLEGSWNCWNDLKILSKSKSEVGDATESQNTKDA